MTAGANPTSLQRGIMKAVDVIVEDLKKISKKVSDRKVAWAGWITKPQHEFETRSSDGGVFLYAGLRCSVARV